MPIDESKNQKKRKSLLYKFLFILITLIGINVIAYLWYTQIDLTKDKRYSTTDATKKMLKNLDGTVEVTVFLKGDKLPAAFKNLSISTEELLKTFANESNQKVSFKFVDPSQNDDAIAILEQNRMQGIPVTVSEEGGGVQKRLVFPWALISFKPRNGTAPRSMPVLLQESNSMMLSKSVLLRSEILLEYNLGSTIMKLAKDKSEAIAYLVDNEEARPPYILSMLNSVGMSGYAMDTLALSSIVNIPTTYKAIIINRPLKPFTDIELFKIDQYVMSGGNVLMAIDATSAAIDSFQKAETFTATANDLRLNELIFTYGARINNNMVLDGSNNAGIPVGNNTELFPWPYFPILTGNNDIAISKNLQSVLGRFPSSIDLNKNNDNKVKKTPLLSTTIYGKVIGLPAVVMYQSVMEKPNLATYNMKNVTVAALLEGTFVSPFMQSQSEELNAFINKNNIAIKNQNSGNGKIILIADADILMNEVKESGQPLEMGEYRFAKGFRFDNSSFFQNCLTYLIEEQNLLEARTKNFENRILDPKRVENETTKWRILAIGLPIVLVGILAAIYTFYRKRKYAYKR